MRNAALLIGATLLLPVQAWAGQEGSSPDLLGSLAQTAGSLILVIGIILLLYYLAGRFLKVPQGGGAGYIRVVETRHFGPKKSLVLVEVGGEYLLLSNSGEGMQFIKQVEMLEEIEVVPERGYETLIPVQLKERVKTLLRGSSPGGIPLGQFKKNGDFA
ncbi:Flagellar biosynthesis protein FliO [Citrifermentans bremense]|uniref:Flagellar protein n=2 Tax=Geobacteraceae TaxID=213422 RepID=A0ABQ0MN94_9BACT|nr:MULTISPECIES: flagellar biosynthetic protein FliO [Geobacteraceae]BCG48966.1 Flagellar biosynthesis protein FliO [Citrifermentans bremense]GAW68552.1 flagellar biosynthesis protein FliO [Geoanaerobacter pelophilus]